MDFLYSMPFCTLRLLVSPPASSPRIAQAVWEGALGAFDRTAQVLDEPTEPPRDDRPPLVVDAGAVEFRHVHFAYETQPVLVDVSFTAPAGATPALFVKADGRPMEFLEARVGGGPADSREARHGDAPIHYLNLGASADLTQVFREVGLEVGDRDRAHVTSLVSSSRPIKSPRTQHP